jgi:hypothetical protein
MGVATVTGEGDGGEVVAGGMDGLQAGRIVESRSAAIERRGGRFRSGEI